MAIRGVRSYRPTFERLETRDVASISSLSFAPHPVTSNINLTQYSNTTSSNPAANPVPFYSSDWQKLHQQYAARAAQGNVNVLFLGDSITQNWQTTGAYTWNNAFASRGAANFGIMGDQTQNILWRIENGELSNIKPRVVVLMAGTNNLATTSQSNIIGGVTAIVNQIRTMSPTTKVLLLGILPRFSANPALRVEIQNINNSLATLNNGNSIRFVDAGPQFLSNGTIRPNLLVDGLHPSQLGYIVLGNALNPALTQMLVTPLPAPPPPPKPQTQQSISVDWHGAVSGLTSSSSIQTVSNFIWY